MLILATTWINLQHYAKSKHATKGKTEKQTKHNTKGYISYDFICIKCPQQANQIQRDIKQMDEWLPEARWKGE